MRSSCHNKNAPHGAGRAAGYLFLLRIEMPDLSTFPCPMSNCGSSFHQVRASSDNVPEGARRHECQERVQAAVGLATVAIGVVVIIETFPAILGA